MPELGEIIAVAIGHDEPNEKCPFCPPQDDATYTTHPGKANDSSHLEAIMEDPSCLVSKQSGARPQTARVGPDGWFLEQVEPDPRRKDTSKPYTFQAHHLISGNQAMKGQSIEEWITASSRNEKDTGYSINSTNNGFWAPSVPKDYVGLWGPSKGVLDDDARQGLAEEVMKDANAQAHIGPHNISDKDDPKGDKHSSYDKYIKGMLKDIDGRIVAWRKECYLCGPKNKKPQATQHVHDVLDNLSTHLQGKITGSRTRWDIFLSKYALEYHRPVCRHTGRKTK